MKFQRNHLLWSIALLAVLASTPPAAGDELFLWEVKGPESRVYLLGSVHFAQDSIYPLDDAIEQAFTDSDTLVVEVDMNSIDPLALQRKMLSAGMYTDGTKLSDTLPADTLEELKAFAAERQFPFQMLDSMKPWFGSLMISMMELRRLGYNPDLGIDKHFLDQAKQRGIPVESLETADFQIDLLSSFGQGLEDELIDYTLDYLDRIPESVDELMTVWRRGDEARLEELLLESETGDERFEPIYEKLFYERNASMAEKIIQRLVAGGNWFVVVGSGHVVGDRGIVSLLGKDDRFTVRRVVAAAVR